MTWTFGPARYEGHTEGPWRSTVDFFGDYTIQGAEELAIAAVVNGAARELTGGCAEQQANARLIADAPHLLAEVLRLRAENERLQQALAAAPVPLPPSSSTSDTIPVARGPFRRVGKPKP